MRQNNNKTNQSYIEMLQRSPPSGVTTHGQLCNEEFTRPNYETSQLQQKFITINLTNSNLT